MKILGYGICGAGEADRYLEQTLQEFKRLCDETVIVLNRATTKEVELVRRYGFQTVVDDREWGVEQNHIKQDLMTYVKRRNPDICICLDMDEVFDPKFTKDQIPRLFETGDALYFYIVNLWNEGWNRQWSFWNIRAWRFGEDIKILNKPLHCGLAPEWTYYNASYAPHFVKHYGLMTKADRQRKIERYQKYDPKAKYKDQSYYDALTQDKNEPLDEDFIRKAIAKEIGVQTKRRVAIPRAKKLFYVQRFVNGKDLGTVDIPESDLKETLALNKDWVLVGEVGKAKDKVYLETNPNECPVCGKILESGEDLLKHKSSHV